jgi:hypothetical protein
LEALLKVVAENTRAISSLESSQRRMIDLLEQSISARRDRSARRQADIL